MLKILTEINGVSGNENEICDFILSQISVLSENIVRDAFGNLIVYKHGKNPSGKKIAVFANMDEPGLIVTDISEDGYIKFATIGNVDSRVLLAKHVVLGKKKIDGVVGIKAVHLQKKEERKKNVTIDDMYIDIGAKNKDDALQYVEKGDYIAFKSDYVRLGKTKFTAKAISSRIGCDVLMNLLKNAYDENIYFCFTVQKEVGMRGMKMISRKINPDISFVFDAVQTNDYKCSDKSNQSVVLGGGPVLFYYGKDMSYDKEIINYVSSIASDLKIKIQHKAFDDEANGSEEICHGASGSKLCRISLPCRHMHTPYSIAEINDCIYLKKIASAVLNSISKISDIGKADSNENS